MPKSYTRAIEIYEAAELAKTKIRFEQAEGRICGEFVFAYPPGIPLAVPGEVITGELINVITALKSAGVLIKNSASGGGDYITIIDNKPFYEKNTLKT